ncbi:MAG: (2Fe-2S)-binding protein [Acidobacteriaceae bacterium]|nr:(2Fe-2S)-binding protein [Acidobacteriaceae bacterium]MBV9443069.1 (2Fe-2S)-binding protein [Acidobacteriaceae bacterium]
MAVEAPVTLVMNGEPRTVTVHPMKRLLDVIREDLKLTGTKEGCGEGECGACAVLVDDKLVNSCLVPVLDASGARICTIEGVAQDGQLHALQKAFIQCGAAQCGICTPGMLLSALQLLSTYPRPNLDQIREALSGNLCRCTGYLRIFEAVQTVAELHG